MAGNGWFKLYRELFDKAIWKGSTPEQKVILVTIMGMVFHDENEWDWKGIKFETKPGQRVTSLDKIAELAGKGISIQNVRTALKKFENYGFLTNESTKTGRLITVVNWGLYQSKDDDLTKRLTINQQSPNKELTPTKNDKNEKKDIYTEDFEKFYKLYPNPTGKAQTFKNWKKVIKEHGPEVIIKSAERYKKSLKEGTEKMYITKSYNFLGQKAVFMDYIAEETEEPKKIDLNPKSNDFSKWTE